MGDATGEYVSLGHFEADDAVAVVDALRDDLFNPPPPKIAVWGRSMGAVAALLYVSEKDPEVSCVIADSAFSSLPDLVHDIVHKVSVKIPNSVS